jgi:hypothetical protein
MEMATGQIVTEIFLKSSGKDVGQAFQPDIPRPSG